MVREGRVFISTQGSGKPQFGSNYYVTAFEPGAQVAEASSGSVITVRAGHGFDAGDSLMVGIDPTRYSTVQSTTVTTLTMADSLSVADGELLVNLGVIGSTVTYDGSGVTIYQDMDYSNVATDSTVQTTDTGRYIYWHSGISRWELVRDSSRTPIAIYQDDVVTLNTINARDYGAVGDGATDDTTALQTALSAVTSPGGEVYIPAGTYLVSVGLSIKSNTHVRGDGIDATVIKRFDNSLTATTSLIYNNCILITGPSQGSIYTNSDPGSSITISDMTLDGNYTAETLTTISNGAYGISTGHTAGSDTGGCIDGFIIERVKVQNVMQDGIYLSNCNNVLIDSCVTYKTGQTTVVSSKNAISFTGGPTDLANGWCKNFVVTNNRISYSGDATTRAAEGIAVIIGDNVTISNNDISHVDYGVEITYTTSGSYENYNYVISGNNIHDLNDADSAKKVGIAIARTASQGLNGLVLSNNAIYNVTHDGIYVANVSGVSAVGNSILKTNLTTDAILFVSMDFVTCTELSITGNSITLASPAAATNGIRLYGATGAVVSGNTVNNNNGSATGANYRMDVSTQDCLVYGNRSIGNKYGIQIHTTGTNSGNSVFGNYITTPITSTYIDSSGQTNYNYGSVEGGAGFRIPSLQSLPNNIGTWMAPTATSGTDTACTVGTIYCGSICCPAGMTITGVQYLIGSVGGTDKVIVSLHNYLGTLLISSDTAGTTVGTLATVQKVAFTTTHTIFQPTWFHIGLTFNGTTAKFRTIPAGGNAGNGVVGGSRSQTFGTPASFTALTTFAADLIPIMSIY